MPEANTKAGNIARDSEFGPLIENRRIEDVAGHIDRSVERNGGVIDQRSQRPRLHRHTADGRAGRRRRRSRDGGVKNRIALEFAWISCGRHGCRRCGYRPCRRQAPNLRTQLGVLFLDLVEPRHHVIECCRSRRATEGEQAESSTGRPRKKSIPHDVSPRSDPTQLTGVESVMYARCQNEASEARLMKYW